MVVILPFVVIVALLTPAVAGEQVARSLAGQFAIVSEQGWPGRRYVEGGVVFAEEFDSNRDNRIDMWRFYRRGILSSEEQDLNHDGRVDIVTTWNTNDPRVQRITGMSRDSRHRGFNDLEMEHLGGNRWRIMEDINGDGIADRILEADGPYQLFEDLALDLSAHPDIIGQIPMQHWIEYQADEGYCGYITDYRRYSRGRQTHYGDWNGRRLTWVRYDPRNPPPPPAERRPALQTQPLTPTSTPPSTVPGGDPIGSPYAGDTIADQSTYVAPDPFASPDPATGYYYDSTAVTPAPTSPASDRTRYEGLPPGESAARSLPARMRPPGVGRR